MSSKVTEDFLARMSRRLRGEAGDVSLEPIVVKHEGVQFKVRRRLHFRIQDWVNSAVQADGSGQAVALARRAAASIISISLDDGETFQRVEELFPLGDDVVSGLNKHTMAMAIADQIIVKMFDSAEFSTDHGSDIIEKIVTERIRADEIDNLKRLADEEKKSEEQARHLRDASRATKIDGTDKPASSAETDRQDSEELFGEFSPLSEAGLGGQ